MKSREKEAYVKAYGKEPEVDFDDEDKDSETLRASSNSSSSGSFVMIPQEEDGSNQGVAFPKEPYGYSSGIQDADMFGDEESEGDEEETTIKSELRASLEAALRKRGGGGGSGSDFMA
jgi:hypothetical protein